VEIYKAMSTIFAMSEIAGSDMAENSNHDFALFWLEQNGALGALGTFF
jgi:hypothetical protein